VCHPRFLGSGGFKSVYAGRYWERDVAVAVLHPTAVQRISAAAEQREELMREVEVMWRHCSRNANIVQIVGVCLPDAAADTQLQSGQLLFASPPSLPPFPHDMNLFVLSGAFVSCKESKGEKRAALVMERMHCSLYSALHEPHSKAVGVAAAAAAAAKLSAVARACG
jgi:hypothetical protein